MHQMNDLEIPMSEKHTCGTCGTHNCQAVRHIEDVAADRVWDALNCALEKENMHCFDPRDRLFENQLRTVAQKGSKDG